MPHKPRPSRVVLDFVDRFGLITPRLAARVAFPQNPAGARLLLGQLSTAGALRRHLCRCSASPRRFAYFTTSAHPFSLARVRSMFAIAEFFARAGKRATALPPEEFADLMRTVSQELGSQPPPYLPCYLRAGEENRPARLSLVWPARSKDMNMALGDLESFVSRERFAPWRAFALAGRLEITCLYRSYRGAAELQRWAQRHPILSRAGGPPVPIPVVVHPAAIPR